MKRILLSFAINNVDNDQTKAMETIVKTIEDLRKWPEFVLKYSQKNNNKEYLFYYELAGYFHLLHCFSI